jgi:tetratricopeptide (TPR) repeat protein
MRLPKKPYYRFQAILAIATLAHASVGSSLLWAADDSFAPVIEAARKTSDEPQLQSLTTRLEESITRNATDAVTYFDLALVRSYLMDVYEMRKDKKAAAIAVDKAIEAVQRSIQLNDKSADAHSLLADLYGRKIPLGNAMLAGPKFGPKVKEENAKAMAPDDKSPRVWASLGRQYLLAPKMFGGDVTKAIESFQKSLAIDPSQDESWVWLARAYEKVGDETKAQGAIQHALTLNPNSPWIKDAANSLN